jgi:hypothetical protein
LIPAITVILLDIKTSVAGDTAERFQALTPLVRVLQSLAERYLIATQALDLLDPALKEAGWREDGENGIPKARENSPFGIVTNQHFAAQPSYILGFTPFGSSKLGSSAASSRNANVSESTTTASLPIASSRGLSATVQPLAQSFTLEDLDYWPSSPPHIGSVEEFDTIEGGAPLQLWTTGSSVELLSHSYSGMYAMQSFSSLEGENPPTMAWNQECLDFPPLN